jgi:hypothetical protein
VGTSRNKNSGLVAGVGFCLGVYVVLAVGFHWVMQPTVFKNSGLAAYKPPPATVVVYSEAPFVPPVPSEQLAPARSEPPSVAVEAPISAAGVKAAAAAPDASEKAAEIVPKKPRRNHVARAAPRRERPVRQVRERRNPWDFAYSPPYGNRPWF